MGENKYIVIICLIISFVLLWACSSENHKAVENPSGEIISISELPNYDTTGISETDSVMSLYSGSGLSGNSEYLLKNKDFADYRKILKKASDPAYIKSINFRKSGLKILPEAISQLKNLETIDLSENPRLDFSDAFTRLAKLKKLRHLLLSDNNFIVLPEEITQLKEITTIDLSQNLDLRLDDAFRKLTLARKLVSLDLSNNIFSEIPEGLALLRNLKRIDLSYNWLQFVPADVFRLTNLKELILTGNAIRQIPDAISSLVHLEVLDAGYNELSFVSDSLYSISGLSAVFLNGNPWLDYDYICSRLAAGCRLKALGLAKNWLKSVPAPILIMYTLEELNLGYNYISSLPQGLFELRQLRILDISGNKIKYLNKNVMKKNLARTIIRNYKGDSDSTLDFVF